MPVQAAAAFALVVLPMVVTPGASFTLMATHVLRSEAGATRRVVAGTALGILTHALLAALGLSALVMQSAQAYRAVQVAGAVYLAALGIAMIVRKGAPKSPGAGGTEAPGGEAEPKRIRVAVAFLASLLNPKAAAVYLTLVPQVLGPGELTVPGVLALALVHAVMMAAWLATGATILRAVGRSRFSFPRKAVDRVGGAVLVGLGVRTFVRAQA
ncbi:LysE family translocator [Salininema proteolyticum]|uniref:LysE family translocator n=1 Tax=Salininema proteolyticum TaxID=1607685 RepID=A0ABV8U031_9ACTN